MKFLLFILSLTHLILIPLPGRAISLEINLNPLANSIYKMEILNYCGLINNRVLKGFENEKQRLIKQSNASESFIAKARSDAWQAGLAEWQNRGLGGFKNWCKTDGLDAQQYFQNIE